MIPARTVARAGSADVLPWAPLRASRVGGRPVALRQVATIRALSTGISTTRSPLGALCSPPQPALRSPFLPDAVCPPLTPRLSSRGFSLSVPKLQDQKGEAAKSQNKPESDGAKGAQNPGESQSKTGQDEEGGPKKDGEQEPEKDGDKKSEESDKKSEEGDKKDKKEEAPPPPHGDKTPWQVFMDTMQSEFKQSKEWNDSTKALAAGAQQFSENENVKRARTAYTSTSGAVSSTASNVLKNTAGAVGKGAAWTWDTSVIKGVRKGANATGSALDKATKPLRDTDAYKNVKNVIDDGSSSRYGGWVEKEERRKQREMRLEEQKKSGKAVPGQPMEEDINAGTNVTLHKDSAWKEAWRDFRDQNKFVQGVFNMKNTYHESENPFVLTARGITDRVAGFFAENETAQVIKKLRSTDPSFQVEPFIRELREYMLPEVLDAYVKGDTETLKLWLSEAQFSVYEALTKQYLQAGLKSDGKILDIRHVDILKARLLEPGEIPVFIITARTQEVHVYRNVKSGKLAAGMEDKVQLVTYALGITRIPEEVNNPETRGWRLIEMQKSNRDYI